MVCCPVVKNNNICMYAYINMHRCIHVHRIPKNWKYLKSNNINLIYYIIKTNKHERECHESFMNQQDKIKSQIMLRIIKKFTFDKGSYLSGYLNFRNNKTFLQPPDFHPSPH